MRPEYRWGRCGAWGSRRDLAALETPHAAIGLQLRAVIFASAAMAAIGAWDGPASGQPPSLPPVKLVLGLEVQDVEGWSHMHSEVLGTMPGPPKPLAVVIPTRAGSKRTILVGEPRFWAYAATRGAKIVRLTVRGTIGGTEAAQSLPAFVDAMLDAHPSGGPTSVKLEYGLSTLTAELVELAVEDR
jgi:hypothetical protein